MPSSCLWTSATTTIGHRSDTMAAGMSPRRKVEFPIEIHAEYLAELRRRIETGPGFGPVADAAKMSRGTLWRVLNGGDPPITVDAVERVKRSLASFGDGQAPMPPPVLAVRSHAHHAWNQIGEAIIDADADVLARAVEDPDALIEAVRAHVRRLSKAG